MTIHGKSKALDKPQRRQASSYREKWFKKQCLKCYDKSSLLNTMLAWRFWSFRSVMEPESVHFLKFLDYIGFAGPWNTF